MAEGLLTWAQHGFQTSIMTPRLGHRIGCNSNSTCTSTDGKQGAQANGLEVIVDGREREVGVELMPGPGPGPGAGQGREEFAAAFEKYAAHISFQFILRNGKETIFQETHAAVLTRTSTGGVWIGSRTNFAVHELHTHVPLELHTVLSVTPTTQQQPQQIGRGAADDDEGSVLSARRMLDPQRYHPPRIPPRHASLSVMVISPLRLESRCRELSPTQSLLTLTVHNLHPAESVRVLLLTLHARDTLQSTGRAEQSEQSDSGSVSGSVAASVSFAGESATDGDDGSDASRGPPGSFRAAAWDMYEFHRLPSAGAATGTDAPEGTLPLIGPNEAYTFAYRVCLRADLAALECPAWEHIERLGDFCTPFAVHWVEVEVEVEAGTGKGAAGAGAGAQLPSPSSTQARVSKHMAAWSLGAQCIDYSAAERHAGGGELSFSLHGPTHARVGTPFILQARVVNLSSASLCDLHLETSAVRPFQQEQQPRYLCLQASTPMPTLSSGESTSMELEISPLCVGQLRLDNILLVSASGRIYRPPWFFTLAVLPQREQMVCERA